MKAFLLPRSERFSLILMEVMLCELVTAIHWGMKPRSLSDAGSPVLNGGYDTHWVALAR